MAPANIPFQGRPEDKDEPAGSPSLVRLLHYAAVILLLGGGLLYWTTKPPTVNPMADPAAAEAMALVQTHRAKQAPTLRQALTDRVQAIAARGQGVRMGDWTVQKQQADLYLVKVFVREEGSRQWFERDYEWQVNLTKRTVIPMSMPAEDLMPLGMSGPLTRGDGPPAP